jgi:hypothetical protein
MPTVQLCVEYDNGERYVSEKHEIQGLGVVLADADGDTLPDSIQLNPNARLLEDVAAMHRDEYVQPCDVSNEQMMANRERFTE